MQELILLIILLALAAIFVLLIYLTDRVRKIEQVSQNLNTESKRDPDADPHFWGLTPQQLWDGMSGKEVPGWTALEFDEIRHRYEYVLNKHIDEVFQQGSKGTALAKATTARIRTLRGFVTSWMPPDLAKTLHQLGVQAGKGEELDALATRLDETCRQLFERVRIKPEEACSKRLLANRAKPSGEASETTSTSDASSEDPGPQIESNAEESKPAAS